MASEQFEREYGQHLVEQVMNGRMSRRQLLVRASVFGLSATTIGTLLAACGGSTGGGSSSASTSPSASAAPKSGGKVTVTALSPLSALDPVTMYQTGDISTVEQICEYLIWVENDFTLRPVLAESWSADSAAQVWTFKLRQGVTFNDGSPFGAEDVVTTFDRLVDPKSGSGALSALKGILSQGGTQKVDDSTVAFHLDKPFADFPYLVSSGDYNSVILSRSFSGDFAKNPVGTGPFMLVDFVPKQSATLKKNPNYWQKGLPYLDGVDFKYNDDAQAQTLQLQSGAVDIQAQTAFQGSQALFQDPNLSVITTPCTAIREVAMRVDHTPYSDKNVRQAVAYCLDRQAIMTAMYDGKATLGNDQVFSPLYPGSPKFTDRTQDYAKAKQLLADSGHADGVDLTLTTAASYLDLSQYATLIQQQCKQAGINIKLHTMSAAEFYGGSSDTTPWLQADMTIVEWSPRPVAAQLIQAMLTATSVWNSSHWANTQFDDLFGQYEATVDEASRAQIATQMGTVEQDDTPVVIAFWMDSLRATNKRVHNVQGLEAYLDLSKAWVD
jgi:peptide/nickel transport system substrate-binding protein